MYLPSFKKLKTKLLLLLPSTLVVLLFLLLQGEDTIERMRHKVLMARGYLYHQEESGPPPTPKLLYTLYAPDCDALLAGNKREVKITRDMLFKESRLSISDKEYLDLTTNCSRFRLDHGYVQRTTSEAFPIAFIIHAKNNIQQFDQLLRAIHHPHNTYCVHIERSGKKDFQKAVSAIAHCFPNVIISSKQYHVIQEGITRLDADMACLCDLAKRKWEYVLNIDAQDFPLKTNQELVHYLRTLQGKNDIPGVIPRSRSLTQRLQFTHILHNSKGVERMVATSRHKSPVPLPSNSVIYMGSAYFVASRSFILYVLHDPTPQAFYKWLADTPNPAQTFWATLQRLPGVPGGSEGENSVWNTHVSKCGLEPHRGQCLLSVEDLRWISQQHQLFASKVDITYDHIVPQCLDHRLKQRLNQEATRQALNQTQPNVVLSPG